MRSPRVLGFEPVEKSIFVEGRSCGAVALISLDVCDGVRVFHHLDETRLVPSGQAAIGVHSVSQKQRKIRRYGLLSKLCTTALHIKAVAYLFIFSP